jgi:hypothetical protein
MRDMNNTPNRLRRLNRIYVLCNCEREYGRGKSGDRQWEGALLDTSYLDTGATATGATLLSSPGSLLVFLFFGGFLVVRVSCCWLRKNKDSQASVSVIRADGSRDTQRLSE